MEKKKKSVMIKTIVCVVIMALLVVGYYLYISNKDFRSQSSKDEEQETLENLLAVDLEKEYPANPREVVVYYSDLICCIYNHELSDEELNKAAVQLRTLLDVELLQENSLKEYIERLKEEIEAYRSEKKTITNYQVFKNSEVKYQKMKSRNYATLSAYYRVKAKGAKTATISEEFLLREDEEGYWRILGWELSNGKTLEE